MQTKEPYLFWTAGTVGLAAVLAPQPITTIGVWCVKVGVVLRALRMVLYMMPRDVLHKSLGGPARYEWRGVFELHALATCVAL